MEISSASSLTRCFCRMITTSDAVQVAAARSSSSTGDVAVFASPATRMGRNRPPPPPPPPPLPSHFNPTARPAAHENTRPRPAPLDNLLLLAVQPAARASAQN